MGSGHKDNTHKDNNHMDNNHREHNHTDNIHMDNCDKDNTTSYRRDCYLFNLTQYNAPLIVCGYRST